MVSLSNHDVGRTLRMKRFAQMKKPGWFHPGFFVG
jgi:hypothetical protein